MKNIPRYVNFTRPEALTLDQLDLASGSDAIPDEPTSSKPDSDSPGSAPDSASPSDAELREPEQFYEFEPEEPEGRLVRLEEGYRIYHMGGDEYVSVVGGYSGKYKDEDGEIQDVDNTLVEKDSLLRSVLGAGEYENEAGAYQVKLPKKLTQSRGVSIKKDNQKVELIPTEGDFRKSITAGSAIRYNDVFANVDYQYTLVGDSVRQDILMLEPTQKNEYSFRIKAPGLKVAKDGQGLLLYKDSKKNPLFVMAGPAIEDAQGNRSFDVDMALTETNGVYTVKVTVDKKWLEEEGRSYPVRLEQPPFSMVPEKFILVNVADKKPSSFLGNNAPMYVGYQDGLGNCHTYVAINGKWADIVGKNPATSATFKIGQKTDNSKGATEIALMAPDKPWNVLNLTWNDAKGQSPDHVGTVMAAGADGILSFDITDIMNSWIQEKRLQAGFRLQATSEPQSESQESLKMAAEVLYNRDNAAFGPRIDISWNGELPEGGLAGMDVNDSTMEVDPAVSKTDIDGKTAIGVLIHGLTQAGATIDYMLMDDGTEGTATAADDYTSPDFDPDGSTPGIDNDQARDGNWQSELLLIPHELDSDVIYHFEAKVTGKELVPNEETGEMEPGEEEASFDLESSDEFLIYEVQSTDLLRRIARHYGTTQEVIQKDNHLPNGLTEEGTSLFIRNPDKAEPYTFKEPALEEMKEIDMLLMGMGKDCIYNFEPINMNTGNFYMNQVDAQWEDLGGTFTLERSYNSAAPYFRSEFGHGWNSPFGERLTIKPDGKILYTKGDGGGLPFVKESEELYRSIKGYDMTLKPVDSLDEELLRLATPSDAATVESDTETEETTETAVSALSDNSVPTPEGWELESTDGMKRTFDRLGFLRYTIDRKGSKTVYRYDEDYNLLSVVLPSGMELEFTTDEAYHITSIGLPNGGKVSYSYDDQDNLTSVTDPEGGTRRYEYDEKHRMTSWHDENNNRMVENTFDEKGRVLTQTDANGGTARLEYAEDHTTATDNNGNTTQYRFDEQKRITQVVYPDGSTETTSYTDDNRVASKTDELGVTTSYTYDVNGNVLTETRADGTAASYEYNEWNLPVAISDFLGNTMTFTYDEKGNLLSTTDAEGNTVSYTYDENSHITAMTDANGGVTTFTYEGTSPVPSSMIDAQNQTYVFTYNEMNQKLTSTDPAGNVQTYTYDLKGRNLEETAKDGGATVYRFDPVGCVTAITDAMGVTTEFAYDKMYNILSGKDALTNTLSYAYDGNYNKVNETDTKGNTTGYTYDSRNRLVKTTDAQGNAASVTYDAKGNAIKATDRRNNSAVTEYDPVLNLPVRTTDAAGNTTAYRYDAMGHITHITYADGSQSGFLYDGAGRITETTDQSGLVTRMAYDGNGNIIRITDDDTRIYTFAYDLNNRLIQAEDPLGGITAYEYDAIGNQIALTNPENQSDAYVYDAMGRLTKATDAIGNVQKSTYDKNGKVLTAADAMGGTNQYHYDVIGQLLASVDAAGNVTAMEYDGLGNVTQTMDALKGTTKYEYDSLSRATQMADAMGHEYGYTYDPNGNITKLSMPDGDSITMTYDAVNQISTSTDEAGVVTTYVYDAMGRIIKASDTTGNVMTYEYDAAGNLIRQTDTIDRSATYTYDKFSRLSSATGTDGAVTAYAYDALDRLISVTDAEGKVTAYEYDKVGNLIKTTEPGQAVYTYAYDAINRLTDKVNPLGAATTFQYDANGNLTQTKDAEDSQQQYAYDVLNRMTALTDGNGGITAYEYDELSRPLSITTPEGNKQEYRYDPLGNMLAAKDANGLITEYRYDVMSNLVQAISPKGTKTAYTYDKHDEVTSVTDTQGNTTDYEVSLNRMVTKLTQKNGGEYNYSYDRVHRLTGVTTPLGLNTEFTYDTADNVTRESDSLGRATSYEYDVMHRMTKSVNAKDGTETYEYDIRGNLNTITDAMGYKNTMSYDLLDQLKESVDPEGKATKAVYDMVGNITGITTPGERTTNYYYDKNYNTTAVSDPKGYIYASTYDRDNRLTKRKDPLAQTEEITYDPGSRITALQDKMGLTQSFTYDNHGNMLTSKATNGLITNYTYDSLDNMTKVKDPMSRETSYAYDVMGSITSMTDAKLNTTKYTYDLEGNMTSLTSPMGRKESYTYDAAGRTTERLTAKGDTIRYDYDKLNGLADKTYEDKDGAETDHPVQMGYNAMGQRISMEDITGGSSFTYDSLGRLKTAVNGSGKTIEYTYDEADNLGAILYPDGKSVSYGYDKNDNVTSLTDRDGRITTFRYDPLNRVTEIQRPNGIKSVFTYNARNQVMKVENTCECGFLISNYSYTYDDAGLITAETAKECLFASASDFGHQGGENDPCLHADENYWQNQNPEWETTKSTFKYDNNGQLLEAKEDKGAFDKTTYRYKYDEAGNRTYAEKKVLYENAQWAKYTYNADNQMTASRTCDGYWLEENYTYKYDANGNLTAECLDDYAKSWYLYDTENRLKAVYDGEDILMMAAAYDGDGNRAFQLNYDVNAVCGYGYDYGVNGQAFMPENSHNEDGSLTAEGELFDLIERKNGRSYDLTEYVNDTNREYTQSLMDYSINGESRTGYSYAGDMRVSRNSIWKPNDVDTNDVTGYYGYDGRGSVTNVTNCIGMSVAAYQYTPYGQVTLGGMEHKNFYGYNAESYNPNTGLEYLRARYYNPNMGRFFQEDTYLGDITDPLTLNRYAYVKNSPLNYMDPSGNFGVKITDEHKQIKEYASQWNIKLGKTRWTVGDTYRYAVKKDTEYLLDKKKKFVKNYKDVLYDAAEKYDIPITLLAGVAYNEYGGDPVFIDDVAYFARNAYKYIEGIGIGKGTSIDRESSLTSFGYISIQMRRAAETLGYNVSCMNEGEKISLIESIKSPLQNIYIVASHLKEIQAIDYGDISSDALTQEQIIILATRYNRGPELSLEKIKEYTEYGDNIYRHENDIMEALKDET